jgi:hypothetical protein
MLATAGSVVCFGLSGKIIQEFIQRAVSSFLGRPVRAIAGPGHFHAHGLLSALDLAPKGIGATAASAYDDKIGSASIIGVHPQSD